MPQDLGQNEKHFHTTLQTQKDLVVLIEKEAYTRAQLVQIQTAPTPHMEILWKELAYVENVLKKFPNLSMLDGLVHLTTKTTIQIKSLEFALHNWDVSLRIVMGVNKTFLDKYSVRV